MFRRMLIVSLLILTTFGCGKVRLPGSSEEVAEIVARLVQAEESSDAEMAADLERFHAILLGTFGTELEPIPEDDIKPFIPETSLDPIDEFRWGVELPSHPQNDSTAGALVARPVSTDFGNLFDLAVRGPWTEMFPGTYRTYDRSFENSADEALIDGSSDTATASNTIVNLADRGIVFAYDSTSVFRRVQNLEVEGTEVLLHWEYMDGEAERIEGGLGGYLRFLINFQIFYALDSDTAWRVAVTWTEAGGSVLGIGSSATSGDIGAGIRRDYNDLENYLQSSN